MAEAVGALPRPRRSRAGRACTPTRPTRPAAGLVTRWHRLVPRRLRADLLHRRRRRARAAQPARDPAVPRADAERGEPRADRVLAHARQQRRPDLRADRDGRRRLRGDGRPRPDRRDLPPPPADRRRRAAGAARDEHRPPGPGWSSRSRCWARSSTASATSSSARARAGAIGTAAIGARVRLRGRRADLSCRATTPSTARSSPRCGTTRSPATAAWTRSCRSSSTRCRST